MINKYASTLVHQWVPKPNIKRGICCSYGQEMILQLGRLYFVGMIVEHQVSRAEESRRRGSWLIEFECTKQAAPVVDQPLMDRDLEFDGANIFS